MASDLKNLTDQAAKLATGRVYDTNWCDIPAEIKLKCIAKLEFKERLSLRRTAKAERSLVDSQKIGFRYGRFQKNEGHLFFLQEKSLQFLLNRDYKHIYSKGLEDINEALELMNYIKKVGVFENLEVSSRDFFTNHEQFITEGGLFAAKNIEFKHCDVNTVVAVLRKMENGVESIKIDVDGEMENSLDETLAISHVQNVPYWHIKDYYETDSLYKVAQIWIDENSKIGNTFQVSVRRDGSFGKFLEHFTDRIVSKNDKRVRIRTNSPDRHILLERGIFQLNSYPQYFRLMVISAEMKESEYDDNCKKWISKIDVEINGSYYPGNSFDPDDVFEYHVYDALDYFDTYGRNSTHYDYWSHK